MLYALSPRRRKLPALADDPVYPPALWLGMEGAEMTSPRIRRSSVPWASYRPARLAYNASDVSNHPGVSGPREEGSVDEKGRQGTEASLSFCNRAAEAEAELSHWRLLVRESLDREQALVERALLAEERRENVLDTDHELGTQIRRHAEFN